MAEGVTGPPAGAGARPPGAGGDPRGRAYFGFLVALSVFAAGSILARQATYGVGLDWDALNYIAVARHLLAGEGFRDFDGGPFTLWTPLYPLLLAVFGLGRFDAYAVAGPLGALSFGLTVFFVGRFLGEHLESPFLRLWAPVAAALSLPLAEISWFGRSEAPFILFATLALIRLEAFLRHERRSTLVWAGVFAALAFLSRYMGVAVLAVGGALLLTAGGAAFGARLKRAAAFSVIAGLPMGGWLLRNSLLIGTLTGHRRPVDYSPVGLLADIGGGVAGWGRFDFGGWPGLLLGAAAAAGLGVWSARRGDHPGAGRRPAPDRLPAAVFGGFALTYLTFLYAALLLGNTWNGVEARYLTPAYLPLLVAGAVLLDRVPAPLRVLRGGAFTLLALWALGQAAPLAQAVARANSAEPLPENGYGGAFWRRSRTLDQVREHFRPGDTAYSNLPAVVYFYTGGRGGAYHDVPYALHDFLPRAGGVESPQSRVARWLRDAAEGAWVVWFWDGWKPFFTPPPALVAAPGLSPVAEFSDGVVFRVSGAAASPGEEAGAAGKTDPYRAALDRILSGGAGEPVSSSVFDLYLEEDSLLYHKNPCVEADLTGRFILHLYSADRERLPPSRRDYGFANRDFQFGEHGVLFPPHCVASVPLPDFEVTRIRAGRRAAAEEISSEDWSAEARPLSRGLDAALEVLLSGGGGEPVARSVFDLYLDRETLAYVKRPCRSEDTEARFFLHLYPEAPDSLAEGRRRHGFENRDFDFPWYGTARDGACIALAPLPEYRIARIRTGQWVADQGESWSVEIAPAEPDAEPASAALPEP